MKLLLIAIKYLLISLSYLLVPTLIILAVLHQSRLGSFTSIENYAEWSLLCLGMGIPVPPVPILLDHQINIACTLGVMSFTQIQDVCRKLCREDLLLLGTYYMIIRRWCNQRS